MCTAFRLTNSEHFSIASDVSSPSNSLTRENGDWDGDSFVFHKP